MSSSDLPPGRKPGDHGVPPLANVFYGAGLEVPPPLAGVERLFIAVFMVFMLGLTAGAGVVVGLETKSAGWTFVGVVGGFLGSYALSLPGIIWLSRRQQLAEESRRTGA